VSGTKATPPRGSSSGDSVIETERLRLRPFALRDLDDVHALFTDPVVMRFSISGVRDRHASREWLESVIDKYREHGHGFLAAILKEEDRYVGHAGLLLQEVDGRREIEIAYWFLRRYWGRGLATEAACACRDYGLDVLGCRRLISLIDPENVASRRVAEKVGMIREKLTTWKDTQVCVYSLGA
jgi:ribosomal-protein-alanine N-acetyltransferase